MVTEAFALEALRSLYASHLRIDTGTPGQGRITMIERAEVQGQLRQGLSPLMHVGSFAGLFFTRRTSLASQRAPRVAHWLKTGG